MEVGRSGNSSQRVGGVSRRPRLVEGPGMNLTRQAVSKHLAVLEDADLVDVRWVGRTKLHSGKLSAHLPRLIEWLNKHERKGEVGCESS